ncbi:hypothetical protein ACIO1C_18345 [Streptomyces sp. NPDC087420]|uniref:hypothetical protein n=1 Tax=Streptomyces sp. NPDC087420 TaxID=3365785 RepID=UPI003834A7D8
MNTPLSRTILLLDIERYSDRDDVEQGILRRMLYDVADRTLDAAHVDEAQRSRADRGDSVMELIAPDVPVSTLLRAVLTELPDQLRNTNRLASSSAQIRLRVVLAGGYVAVDPLGGWVGSDLNHACRLLDADELRAALGDRTDDFALCVSDSIYQGVVRHGHLGIRPEDFHSITPDSKNGPLSAWLHGPVPPGQRGTKDKRKEKEREGAKPAPNRSDRPVPPSAVHIAGDQYGMAGGTVEGDASFTFGPRSGADRG